MKKFRTYLLANNQQVDEIKQFEFQSISIEFKNDPSLSHWESNDGRSTIISHKDYYPKNSQEYIPFSEILINSENEDIAEGFLSLVNGGVLLAFPDPFLVQNSRMISEVFDSSNIDFTVEPFSKYFKFHNNIGIGFKVADKAFTDDSISYAIEKYRTSLNLFSIHPSSVDPIHGHVFENYNSRKDYHTNAAFAIIAAFSVIEELKLEIRSSNKNKRFVDNELGIWNLSVYNELNERLIINNISTDETFDWVYRGEPTEIEKNIKPYFGIDSEWIRYGKVIRDKTLSIQEAIHNASYLRNYIASHKFKDLTKYISPYDVFNVQSLARFVILKKMDMWRFENS